MSKLPGTRELAAVSTQLPLSWYFDQDIAEIEKRLFFENGPGYVGHELMVPEPGNYYVLPWMNEGWALLRKTDGIDLISNVCRHRQAVMLKGRGKLETPNIVCPIHRWTYDLEGRLLGAPHFPQQPCLDLPRQKLQKWNGMLFNGKRDIAGDLGKIGCANDLDFSGYVLDKVDIVEYNFNWKTFIEVYIEDYHVAPFHPGLGSFVDCDQLEWEFGDWYSVQTVGVNQGLTKPGSETYRKWHEMVLNYRGGKQPPYGAIWLTYYPNIMVEWYPHVLVISTVVPRGAEKCTNIVEFYYPEEIALFEREFVAAEQKAYNETAVEDDEICARMTAGRRALWLEGREEHGPYQSPMEDGMVHFHEFMRREMARHENR
jgi:phenylpropionate dioxygenase-like ring-hydroxylating dioxygenase large terminal subunit